MSSRAGRVMRTPSFSSISNFSGFGSSPSSPESSLLPLSSQNSPPASPGNHSPKALRSATSVRFDLFVRALGLRVKNLMKGGQLPLIVVFTSCLLIFVGALSGVGYVDSDLAALASTNDAQVLLDSAPVIGEQGPSQRELEEIWRKMGRGQKDGEWLRKVRDKRENRRVAPEPVARTDDEGEVELPMGGDEAMTQSVDEDIDASPPRVINEADRKPRQPDSIFDYNGHDWGHEEELDEAEVDKLSKLEKAGKPLDVIMGGKTKEEA